MGPPAQSSPGSASTARYALDVERVLDSFAARTVFSIAIIVSLLPMEWAEDLDPLFLLLFGSEFCVRLFVVLGAPPRGAADTGLTGDKLLVHAAESKHSRFGAWTLLVVDFVALLSFLPIVTSPGGARWLRLFRLTRMVLLVGYWAPLVRDLWSIMARGERARQILLMAFVVGGLSFAGAVVLHHLGDAQIDANGDDVVDAADRNFINLLWWAFRQVQDPGNLLQSPHAIPVLATSMLLTLFGLFLISFLIGLGTDVVAELLELSRLRPPGLRNHTVVVGVGPSTHRLLTELMRYYRKLVPSEARTLSPSWWRDLVRRGVRNTRYLIVGRTEDPPDFLRQPDLARIVYRQRPEQDDVLVARADLLAARRVLLLADPDHDDPDVETVQTLMTLVERLDTLENDFVGRQAPRGLERVIIAEVLDESNVPAARAALRGGRAKLRAFVVPTERLLALFVAGVVRRPGLGKLLEELLTSSGHEIYTCFFQTEGLGFRVAAIPPLPRDPGVALEGLVRRGLDRGTEATVVPLGLLTACPDPADPRDFEVCVNPAVEPNMARARGREYVGFVAVADSFRTIREFTEELVAADPNAPPLPATGPRVASRGPAIDFLRARQTPLGRVLVCGFRPGTIYVLEELLRDETGSDVLLLVASDEAADEVAAAIETHSALVSRGLVPARHAAFVAAGEHTFILAEQAQRDRAACVRIAVADWVRSRTLVDLPHGFGHVDDLDAVIFVAARDSDARTTTALLKLEALLAASEHDARRPRIVAEVGDGRLAARLQDHCRRSGSKHVRVYSIQQLRAFFLFQSVVVPGFDAVYSELLGSWGQSLVQLRPAGSPTGTCTFAELAMRLWDDGMLLIGVELRTDEGRRLCVAPAKGELGSVIDLSKLRSAWVVAADRSEQAAAAPPQRPAKPRSPVADALG